MSGLPRSVPAFFVPRGTGIETEVCSTSGTGTKFRGTVPSRPLPILGFYYQFFAHTDVLWSKNCLKILIFRHKRALELTGGI